MLREYQALKFLKNTKKKEKADATGPGSAKRRRTGACPPQHQQDWNCGQLIEWLDALSPHAEITKSEYGGGVYCHTCGFTGLSLKQLENESCPGFTPHVHYAKDLRGCITQYKRQEHPKVTWTSECMKWLLANRKEVAAQYNSKHKLAARKGVAGS